MAKALHERRRVTLEELGAFFGTLGMLQAKVLTHTHNMDPTPKKHEFNMALSCAREECGSVSCFGGTMAMIMHRDPSEYVGGLIRNGDHSDSLHELFFPPQLYEDSWKDITVAQTIRAAKNWLKDGKPRWRKILT